ncbi:hypothetical protein Y1Q_0024269 [Alligator mississippiensis]|uniref:Uncharacterized protein n=1 Tax=Alligator mississippiensis TaxID=8496 RepID=A0A151NIE4_ALLMI|nr:hypothetical protein Y1Q_0024269 [Alligator mississippiensis]
MCVSRKSNMLDFQHIRADKSQRKRIIPQATPWTIEQRPRTLIRKSESPRNCNSTLIVSKLAAQKCISHGTVLKEEHKTFSPSF